MPKVSVIIPTYNRAHFLCDALDSVLNQTFKDFEIIVVDDGSTDNTQQALEKYKANIYPLSQKTTPPTAGLDECEDATASGDVTGWPSHTPCQGDNPHRFDLRSKSGGGIFRYHWHARGVVFHYIYQENQGRSQAKNTGIKVARGDYIAFLDDDDIWLPGKLEKQVAFFDAHPGIGLVHTFTEVIDEDGQLLAKETRKRLKFYKKAIHTGYTYQGMSRLCIMFLSTVMVRKECLERVGLFDLSIPAFEDWDFYLRLALKYRIGTIPEPLVSSRMHKTQSTMEEFTRGRIRVAMKHLALSGSYSGIALRRKRLQYNFYLHLANAYYIDMQLGAFRAYALKALKLNPGIIFASRLGLHLLASLMPQRITRMLRLAKRPEDTKAHSYPERIIPEETFGGPLASHLKRYDFAKAFCLNKIVLDAACGAGYGSDYLAEAAAEVIAIDKSEKAIIYAKGHYQRKNLQFKVMDVYKLDFPDKYFDVVCSFETLEHVDNPERFILEAKRVLKEAGVFILSTPNVKNTTCSPKNPYHKREFSRKDFQGLLKKYFREVEIFGQRRLQSIFHYYLQKIDIFHLRAMLSTSLRRKICHVAATHSWDEAGLRDFIISKEGIMKATELVGICSFECLPRLKDFYED